MTELPTDAEMFEHCEKERLLAAGKTDDELADALLNEIMSCIGLAESEFARSSGEDDAHYRNCYGIVREAAFRLSGKRDYKSANGGSA